MNNAFQLGNELNSFRSSVGELQGAYDHAVEVGNANTLAKRTKAIANAADVITKGTNLARAGFESEGALGGLKLTKAAGKAIYNKFFKKGGKAKTQEEGENGEAENGSSSDA